MEWWGYAIIAGNIISQVLAWTAKLRWSAEYKDAKEAQIKSIEETIKSKDAHIALLEKEIQNLRELTPPKLREYLVATRQTLEEYNNSLQKKNEELQEEKAEFDRKAGQLIAVLKKQADIWEENAEKTKKATAAIKSSQENRASASVSTEGQ